MAIDADPVDTIDDKIGQRNSSFFHQGVFDYTGDKIVRVKVRL